MKRILANLSYSFAANLVSMLVSVLIVLLIPRFWGEIPYGYYQLYLFYISYVGFFHLGWVDGIYLRIGGKKYSDLNKPLYASQFYLLTVLVAAVAGLIAFITLYVISDTDKRFVVYMMCVCMLMYLPVTYINYLCQATNRIKQYAQIVLSEKCIFVIGLFLLLMSGNKDFHYLVYADIAGKFIALCLAVWFVRDIICSKLCGLRLVIKEAILNISIGCKLMIANVASMLIIGIVRFAIEGNWGVVVFGKVSLALSISNLFITFVTAASVVLFPVLKQIDGARRVEIYDLIRQLLMPCLFFMLFFYCPAQYILGNFLPAYRDSLRYLAIMLPVCVFECKTAMLINTYLKVLRKEKQILYVNLAALLMSLIMTLITVYGLQSLTFAVCGIVVLIAFRTYIGEYYLHRVMGISVKKEISYELFLTVVFILTSWFLESWLSMAIYAFFYVFYFWKNREGFLSGLRFIKSGGNSK